MAISLPTKYSWLAKEGGPKLLIEALKEYGVVETPGSKSNPKIMSWAKELGISNIYTTDSIPWCGLFMAIIAKRSDKPIVKDPLWALNWGTFGIHSPTPMLGDVLVFTRKTPTGTAGHVGIYIAESDSTYHVLGGNTSDKVTISELKKDRLYQARRPKYINQPVQVRKIKMSASGVVSSNEQ